MTDQDRDLILKMRTRGATCKQIADITGLPVNTIKTFCRRNLGSKTLPDEKACEMCGAIFKVSSKQPSRRFCCDECRMKWWAAHSEQIKRKAYYKFECLHCGVKFKAYGNDHRQFCSTQCYNNYRRGEAKHGR